MNHPGYLGYLRLYWVYFKLETGMNGLPGIELSMWLPQKYGGVVNATWCRKGKP
jgi:hypothetical protein